MEKCLKKLRLSVIVLLYKGNRWIDTCVRSLENQSLGRESYEIILVDNGGFTTLVRDYRQRNGVHIITFPVNCGFAGGYNKAIPCAGGEIILLMNQDVMVHYNCLEEIIGAFDSHPEAGVVSASMLMVSEKKAIDSYGFVDHMAGYYTLSRFGYASYRMAKCEDDLIPVEFVSGNALGFRKIILPEIGNRLFDSYLVSYAEDLDLSIRLATTDWKMYVCRKAIVYHFRDEAFSGKAIDKVRKLIHISSNRLLVYYNNLGAIGFLKKLPSLLIGIPLKVGRLDGEANFNSQRFIYACALLPLILLYFIKRQLKRNR